MVWSGLPSSCILASGDLRPLDSTPASPPKSRFGFLRLSRLSITGKLVLIVLVFVSIVLTLLPLVNLTMTVGSAVRAYVGGEGLWSKGQKDAVYYLMRYALSHGENDYEKYRSAIAVPLGDRKARLELERLYYDSPAVTQGFLEGGNHALDIPNMIFLFRTFRNVSYLDQAITIWGKADVYIDELRKLGDELHQDISRGSLLQGRQQEILDQIEAINAKVTPLEREFSASLGEGARWVRRVLLRFIWTVTVLFLAMGLALSLWIARHLRARINRLRAAAIRVAAGDFSRTMETDSGDELGDLAVAFNQMIAQRENAERELTNALSLLSATLESTADGILVVDRNGKIVSFNRKFVEMWGIPESVVTSRDDHQAIAYVLDQLKEPEGFLRKVRELYADPGAESFDLLEFRDGKVFERYSHAQNIGGQIVGRVWSFRDITARKRVEEELKSARDEALKASVAKSQFLASMSHEIRTPMNSIIGLGDLMWETPLNAEQRRYVQGLTTAGNTLLNLINDILDLSKIESGRIDFEATEFDIRELAEKAAEVLAVHAHEKGLELVCRVMPEVPRSVVGDPSRLRQVLVNLVGNAIKFTERGEVVIRVEKDPAELAAGTLRFTVSDTGIGIPRDKIQAIFESFTQADSSTTRKYGGSGLGLTICKQLVELMKGRIWVESKVGQGSAFTFTARFDTPQSDLKTEAPGPDGLKGLRTLIVDDNAANRITLRELLTTWGAVVNEAPGGVEALAELRRARASREPYQMLLLDSRMPDLNGFQVAEQARRDGNMVENTIMLVTSRLRSGDRDRFHDLGVTAFLEKPVKPASLLEAISAARTQREEPHDLPVPRAVAELVVSPVVLHILLAEDSEDNRLLIQTYFRKTSHQIDIAENGAIAVEKFKSGDYDLVLMDMQMPVLDGYDATQAIRRWEAERGTAPVPIIALTAYALKDELQKSLNAGCTTYLTKPVKKALLMETIFSHAKRASA